jgi:hypothetical protein
VKKSNQGDMDEKNPVFGVFLIYTLPVNRPGSINPIQGACKSCSIGQDLDELISELTAA